MKKSLLTSLLILSGVAAFAQVSVRLGAEAGATMTMLRYKNSASESNASPASRITTPGVRAGLLADIALSRSFYLQPGVFYAWTNSRTEPDAFYDKDIQYQAYNKYSIHNLQIPVYALYKSSIEGMGRFIVGAGPYLGYAFSGKLKESSYTFQPTGTQFVVEHIQQTHSLKIGDSKGKDELRSLDYGATATIGYESNIGLYFRAQGTYGLANLMPGGDADHAIRNWGFGVSIGYLFGRDTW